jgi:1-acyl-sn-glycerol-3-phosphate acyltransferase
VTRSYRSLRWLVRSLLWIFFRRIEIAGLENIPDTAGGVIVAWHPNALVDPALIFASFPRRIVFGARHGLFSWPIIGRIMRGLGCVPFYRPQDFPDKEGDESRREANRKSVGAMADAVAGGAFTALFPEGLSHDDPAPRAVRPGAARLFRQAVEQTPADKPQPVLLPVGLHYNEKRVLGSGVLIVYHPPLELDPALLAPAEPGTTESPRHDDCQKLTAKIEQSLKETAHATESWEIHHLLNRARKLVRAERAARAGASLPPPSLAERVLAFGRLWTGYNERLKTHPAEVRRLLYRIREYDAELAALGVDDHELEKPRRRHPLPATLRLVLEGLLVFLILPPLLAAGYLVNLPPALIVWAVTRSRARELKDEATIKLLAGVVLFPAAWLTAALIAALWLEGPGWLIGCITVVVSAIGGFLILNYQRFALHTMRAITLRGKHADQAEALERLRLERGELCDQVVGLSTGLELPGTVLPDGRVLEPPNL